MPFCYRKIGAKQKVNNIELLKSYKLLIHFHNLTSLILLKIQ